MAKEKKSIYNDDSLLIITLFLKLTDRRCSFLYTGLIENDNDADYDYYIVGTVKDEDFKKNDSSFSIFVLRVFNKSFRKRIKDFFETLKLNTNLPMVINLKNLGAILNKVKNDLSKIDHVSDKTGNYWLVDNVRKDSWVPYTYEFTKSRLRYLFNGYNLFFNKKKNSIDVFCEPYDSDNKLIAQIRINYNGKMKNVPIMCGFDNLIIKDLPKESIKSSEFIVCKVENNDVFQLAHMCKTNDFECLLSRCNLLLF